MTDFDGYFWKGQIEPFNQVELVRGYHIINR